MREWLTRYLVELVLLAVASLSAGWVGLNRRRDRQLKECRTRCRKLDKEIQVLRRDYHQSLEFNLQDRFTIRELAKMVQECRRELKLPEVDILLEVYKRAEADRQARRLSASLHTTSSPQLEGFPDE